MATATNVSSDFDQFSTQNAGNISSDQPETVDNSGGDSLKLVAVVYRNGKVGAACYHFGDKVLDIYEETLDQPSQFFITNCIIRECNPQFVITFGSTIGDDFVKAVMEAIDPGFDTFSESEHRRRSLPENMFLLPVREYSFETCQTVLSQLPLSFLDEESEMNRELYLNSHINFDQKMSVHAAGALVKYADKNWAHFLTAYDELQYMQINLVTMKNHVLIDGTTMKGLQIFQQNFHDAAFKRGLQSSSREGLSIYKMFSSHCKSKLGQTTVRDILKTPVNDLKELRKRQEFIAFVLHPGHHEYVEKLQDYLKNISDVQGVLIKIKHSRAKLYEWHNLYKAIYASVYVNQLSSPFNCEFLNDLKKSVSKNLITLEHTIDKALDFSAYADGRPVIKQGVDAELDAKKLQFQDTGKYVSAAAQVAAQRLPHFVEECSVMYLPEMGHLITIKEWEDGCDPNQLKQYGYELMFNLRGTFHYKNPLCVELDEKYGDINAEIIAHEIRIIHRLSSFVMKYSRDIKDSLKILGKLDAFTAMARVGHKNNYVRPKLNDENMHEIQDCRHPLLDLSVNYQPNSYKSKHGERNVKIITGPNGSGKSVYLKQVALAIFLAHLGCYVPAKYANIGMIYSIHTRLQSTESISVRLSAFMIDITQSTKALHNARYNSIVLLDEFGRGTVANEGFAILKAFLDHFIKKPHICPHILVATHFQKLSEFLTASPLVEYIKMTHTIEDGKIFNLYKIEPGVSRSFAFEICEQIGIDEDVIKRAREIMLEDVIGPNEELSNVPDESDPGFVKFLFTIEIPEPDD